MNRFLLLALVVVAFGFTSAATEALAQSPQQETPPPVVVVEQGAVPPGYGAVQVDAQPTPVGYSGYLVAPALDPNWVNARMQELAALREEYSGYSLALPITMTVLGGVVFGIAGFTWLIGSALCDGFSSECGDFRLKWGIATFGGAVLLTAGIILTVTTTNARRPIGQRIRQLRTELGNAGVQVAWGVMPTPTGMTAGLSMTF